MRSIWKQRVGLLALWSLGTGSLLADDWPQWLGPNRDSVWRESGVVEKFPANGPPVLWRAGIGGGYSGPAGGTRRAFVTHPQRVPGASQTPPPFPPGGVPRTGPPPCF